MPKDNKGYLFIAIQPIVSKKSIAARLNAVDGGAINVFDSRIS